MKNGIFHIVSAGDLREGDLPVALSDEDFLCAADAGYLHLRAAGQRPALIIGDFDSMREDSIPEDIERILLPVDKDDTDTVFAVREGIRRGYRRFRIYGGLGGHRISHTFANIQLLTMIRDLGGEGEIVQGKTRILLGNAGSTTRFEKRTDGSLSVFSLTDRSVVTLRGLYYTLDKGTLLRSFPLGVSNHFIGEEAEILIHEGEVLIILED
ncbi:MAG: thiamine diphosphokinase [Lachnospiraceae bacterium]|nr:thiamine diphosphokinase [Lachnospiraceae bacterium]